MIEIETQASPEVAGRLMDVVLFVCDELEIDRATLGLMIVDADEMAAINGTHRNTPKPTDVLSFPVDGQEGIAQLAEWPEDGPAPELGDIIICPEAAEESLETLAVHGLLHLLGYDHETDSGEMLSLQDDLMDRYAAQSAA